MCMNDYIGWLVCSQAGRDKGALLCVVGVEGDFFLLADGKRRKLAKPKRKKCGHVAVVDEGSFPHPVLDAVRRGEPVSDRALRRALAAFREESRRV